MGPQLIDEARRHQRRRRKIVGTFLIAPLAVGCLIVGVVFVDAGGQSKVVAHSAKSPSKWHTSPALPKQSPSSLSPSNVVVLNPATGDVVAANPSERPAAAQQAAQRASQAAKAEAQAAASAAAATQQAAQEASQAANAEAQAAAAAAAATQSTHR